MAAVRSGPSWQSRSRSTRKRPEWMRVRARFDDGFLELKQLARKLDLHTVCEEAGCPNIYECWSDRTATFMINGDRCTRACGFCQVDTRKPLALDADEPQRVADAVAALGLAHAVITCVARDDLPDGGASGFAATVHAIRATSPGTAVELLIADCKGDAARARPRSSTLAPTCSTTTSRPSRGCNGPCGRRRDTRDRSRCSAGPAPPGSSPSRV